MSDHAKDSTTVDASVTVVERKREREMGFIYLLHFYATFLTGDGTQGNSQIMKINQTIRKKIYKSFTCY